MTARMRLPAWRLPFSPWHLLLAPIAIFVGLFGLLAALSGTRIEVNSPQASVFIHIF